LLFLRIQFSAHRHYRQRSATAINAFASLIRE
jgi:hypothetical protein